MNVTWQMWRAIFVNAVTLAFLLVSSTVLGASSTLSYSYDAINRVTNSIRIGGGAQEQFILDSAGNRLQDITRSSTPVVDTAPPSVPTGLTTTVIATDQVKLSWNESIDVGGSGFGGYSILLDGVSFTNSPTPTVVLSGLAPNKSYVVSIVVFDRAGNRSKESSPLRFKSQQIPPQFDWSNFDATELTYGQRLTLTRHFNATLMFNNKPINPVTDFSGTEVSLGEGVIRYYATSTITMPEKITQINAATVLSAGEYRIDGTFTPDEATQPDLPVAVSSKLLQISKAVLTLTTRDQWKAYLENVPSTTPVVGTTLDVTGFSNGDNELSAGIAPPLELDYGRTDVKSDVDSYVIKSKGGQDSRNYKILRANEGRLLTCLVFLHKICTNL